MSFNCDFWFNKLNQWISYGTMDGPISVVFADICLCKMEEEADVPVKPIFANFMLTKQT